jgi:hypothetical protein
MSERVEFALVPWDQVPLWWEDVRHWLRDAMSYSINGDWRLEGVAAYLREGRYQLVLIHLDGRLSGAAALELLDTPKGRVLAVPLVGGKAMATWGPAAYHWVEVIARGLGASKIRGHGRPGWVKRLRREGWRARYVIIERDIEGAADHVGVREYERGQREFAAGRATERLGRAGEFPGESLQAGEGLGGVAGAGGSIGIRRSGWGAEPGAANVAGPAPANG